MTKARKQTLKVLSVIGAVAMLFSLMFAMNVAADDPATPTNILSSTKVEAGTQNIERYNVTHTFSWDNEWPDDYDYGAAAYSQWVPADYAKTLTNGVVDDTAAIENGAGGVTDAGLAATAARRLALLVNLGGVYDLDQITLQIPSAQVTNKRYVFDCAVFAAKDKADAVALGSDAVVGHYEHATGEAKVTVDLTGAEGVQYVMVVFNKLGSDPGNLASTTTAGQYGQNAPTGCSYPNGGLYVSEIEVFGTEAPTTPNILAGNTNVRIAYVEHAMDWADTEEDYDYAPEDLEIGALDFLAAAAPLWTNGDKDTEEGKLDPTRGQELHKTHRYAFLYDLGAYYTLDEVAVYQLAKTAHDQADGGDGRMIYGMSVYAGVVDDGSIMNNRIAYYESTLADQTAIKMDVTSDKVVRYVLIVWNKMGSDPGNTRDGLGSPVGTITADSLTGCSWANAAICLSEIEIRGEEAEDPTDTKDFTDTATGVKVHMITYDNAVKVESMVVTKKDLTDAQKTALETEEQMYAPNGLYNITFKDAEGNAVTDMSGRKFTVSFPMTVGDESVYVLNDLLLPTYLEAEVDFENNQLTYECANGVVYFDYIVATMEAPVDPDDGEGEGEGTGSGEDTDSGEGTGSGEQEEPSDPVLPDTGVHSAALIAVLMMGMAAAVVVKARPAKN